MTREQEIVDRKRKDVNSLVTIPQKDIRSGPTVHESIRDNGGIMTNWVSYGFFRLFENHEVRMITAN